MRWFRIFRRSGTFTTWGILYLTYLSSAGLLAHYKYENLNIPERDYVASMPANRYLKDLQRMPS